MKSSDRGLRKHDRLKRRAEFESAYKKGKRVFERCFVAFVLIKEDGPLRLGVVASRRVGNSVERCRAKRLLREVFRNNRPAKAVAADVVLVARSFMKEAGYGEVEKAYARTVLRVLEQRSEDS